MSSELPRLVVGIDDGYAQTKLWGASPDGGEPIQFIMRSSVRPGRFGLVSLSGKGGIGAYSTMGEDFTVSEDVEAESTQFDGFHTSSMNRVLVNHALAAAGYGGCEVDLITGLPLGDYFFDGERDDQKIAAKQANLLQSVSNAAGNAPLARLRGVRVGCQAIAAFVDYLLDDEMMERDVPVGRVAVVDIGGRTTDVAVVLDGDRFDDARSGTENIGVLDVYNTLGRGIRTKFSTRDRYPLNVMDQAIRTRRIKLWGKDEDVSELVTSAIIEQETKIAREVDRRIGSASNVDKVLFVGGGASLFNTIGERFRNGAIAENPEFANSRGLYKYAMKFPE